MSAPCPDCGRPFEIGDWPFCPHGTPRYGVIGDEIPGGFVQENFGHTPETFYSKRAMARRAKELHLEPFVRHVGTPGSDKSPHTSRWI